MASKGAAGHDDGSARRGSLDHPRATEHLRGPLTTTTRVEADAMLDPRRNLPEPPNTTERHSGRRQKGSRRGALELAATHFSTQLPIHPAARHTRAHMSSSEPRFALGRLAGCLSNNRTRPELAHAPRRRDNRDTIELGRRATGSRPNLTKR
jgi:hypothetical protein